MITIIIKGCLNLLNLHFSYKTFVTKYSKIKIQTLYLISQYTFFILPIEYILYSTTTII